MQSFSILICDPFHILHSPFQDSDPEQAEVFLVQLVSVNLADSFQGNASVPPSIGRLNSAQVTIVPNDSPEGELTFINDTYVCPQPSALRFAT